MNQLLQKNGKDWRQFTIVEDGVEAQSIYQNDESSKKILFANVGWRTPEYQYVTLNERRYSLLVSRLGPIVCLLIGFGLLSAGGGILDSESSNVFGKLLISLGIASLVAMVCFMLLQIKKVRHKKVFFQSSGFLQFYCRNNYDESQINAFLKVLDTSQVEYSKQQFLKEFEKNPVGLEQWLDILKERDAFDHSEFCQYAAAIKKATKPASVAKSHKPAKT